MCRNGSGAIARYCKAYAEAGRFLDVSEEHLLVTGRYGGEGKQGGSPLDASFAHLITFEGQLRPRSVRTRRAGARPQAACERLLDVADGVATLRLNRQVQAIQSTRKWPPIWKRR